MLTAINSPHRKFTAKVSRHRVESSPQGKPNAKIYPNYFTEIKIATTNNKNKRKRCIVDSELSL